MAGRVEEVNAELEKLNVQIGQVEIEIKAVEQKIDHVEKELERQENQTEKEYLRKEKEQLRKKEEQLRKEKEQLRKEKELVIQERMQLRSGSGETTGSQQVELLRNLAAEVGKQVEVLGKQGEVLGKQGEVQDKMWEVLQSKQIVKANISKPNSKVHSTLVHTCGFAAVIAGDAETVGTRGVGYRPFDWPQRDEEKDSPYACAHFKSELARFGVKFGRGGWNLLDVRNDKTFLSIQVGNIALQGTTDAVIVPYRVTRNGANLQIRVVLEWKLPGSSEWSACRFQGFAELVAAYACSQSPLIVVVTDLYSKFHILEPSVGVNGNLCLTEYTDIEPSLAMGKVAEFLAGVSPAYDYILDRDVEAEASPYARASKKIKEAVPDTPFAQVLALADFLPPSEREQLIWDAFESQRLWSRDSNTPPPPSMFV